MGVLITLSFEQNAVTNKSTFLYKSERWESKTKIWLLQLTPYEDDVIVASCSGDVSSISSFGTFTFLLLNNWKQTKMQCFNTKSMHNQTVQKMLHMYIVSSQSSFFLLFFFVGIKNIFYFVTMQSWQGNKLKYTFKEVWKNFLKWSLAIMHHWEPTCCARFSFRSCMPSSSLRLRISCESIPLFL